MVKTQKVNTDEIKEICMYYIREFDGNSPNGRRIGCVVIGQHQNGTICRGVSICAPSDNFVRTTAYNKARGRMLKAFYQKYSTEEMTHENLLIAEMFQIETSVMPFMDQYDLMYKSAYNVELTPFELRSLQK